VVPQDQRARLAAPHTGIAEPGRQLDRAFDKCCPGPAKWCLTRNPVDDCLGLGLAQRVVLPDLPQRAVSPQIYG
jgi:hypothetical protein